MPNETKPETYQPFTNTPELEAICNAATPGEWEWERRGWPGNEGWTLFAYSMGTDPFTGEPSKYAFHPMNLLTIKDGHDGFDWNGEANRAFIATAREWLPKLLEERKDLKHLMMAALDQLALVDKDACFIYPPLSRVCSKGIRSCKYEHTDEERGQRALAAIREVLSSFSL